MMTLRKPAHALPLADWRLLKRRPKAHWMDDGGSVLVTGTLDVEQAAQFVIDTEPDMAVFLMDADVKGEPETGTIIPQDLAAREATGFRWIWMARDNGRVKAVNFHR